MAAEQDLAEIQRRKARRTALVLALVAIGFYVAFVLTRL
jgi:hypothetical protein